jgi:hypothetical protein
MPRFLNNLSEIGGDYATLWLILTIVAWALFEWLVLSENKSLMRLSLLGTAAVGLMAVVWITGAALTISFCVGVPATARVARQFAADRISQGDTSLAAIEQALTKRDWDAMQEHSGRAYQAMGELAKAAAAIPALATRDKPSAADELRAHVKAASESLADAQQAIQGKDAPRLETALQKLRNAYGPLREAAKNPR